MIKNSSHALICKGFTLLEMLLVIVLMAVAATLVVETLPDRSDSKEQIQDLQSVLEWATDRAMVEGKIVGLNITENGYRLVVLTHDASTFALAWQPMTGGHRIKTESHWAKSSRLRLEPWRINQNFGQKPQILMMPGGEITPFRLKLQSRNERQGWQLSNAGTLPFTLSSESGP